MSNQQPAALPAVGMESFGLSQRDDVAASIESGAVARQEVPYPAPTSNTTSSLLEEAVTVSASDSLMDPGSDDLFGWLDWSTNFEYENFDKIMERVGFAHPTYSLGHDQTATNLNFCDLAFGASSAQNFSNGDCLMPVSQALTRGISRPGSRFGSRLPSLSPEDRDQPQSGEDRSTPIQRSSLLQIPGDSHSLLSVTAECHQRVLYKITRFSNVVPDDFQLLSRHTLNRFVAMYMAGAHDHNPLLHPPTLALDSVAVELFLAIVAVGARFAREMEANQTLFRLARAIALERIRRDGLTVKDAPTTQANHPVEIGPAGGMEASETDGDQRDKIYIEATQAMIIMMASLWFGKKPGAHSEEAASFRSMLEIRVRDFAERATSLPDAITWRQWVRNEQVKRIVLITFTLLNVQTIILDSPPSFWWTEISCHLPCSEETWNARDEESWYVTRRRDAAVDSVQVAMDNLFDRESGTCRPFFSSLGGYFLIHAILQSIWIVQHSRRLRPVPVNAQAYDSLQFQQVLKKWRQGWEGNQESSMSPTSPFGPLTFTSTALLRLAYVRIATDIRFIPTLKTWSPARVAETFIQSPRVERGEQITRAALHCAHALSIPVKIGLSFIAHTQSFYWAAQHALCSLECALFLSKWLANITESALTELSKEEMLVLEFIIQIVGETPYASSRDNLLATKRGLGKTVIYIWASLYPGGNHWEMVDLVGASLRACADAISPDSTL